MTEDVLEEARQVFIACEPLYIARYSSQHSPGFNTFYEGVFIPHGWLCKAWHGLLFYYLGKRRNRLLVPLLSLTFYRHRRAWRHLPGLSSGPSVL